MNITEIISLIISIIGLIGALITIFIKLLPLIKTLKGKIKLEEILRLLPIITAKCEKTGESGETKLSMALAEVEKLCADKRVEFNAIEWTKNINDLIEYTKQVNYNIKKSRAK